MVSTHKHETLTSTLVSKGQRKDIKDSYALREKIEKLIIEGYLQQFVKKMALNKEGKSSAPHEAFF